MTDEDQDQGTETGESKEQSSEDTQQDKNQDQSNKGEEAEEKEEVESFDLPDGRKVDAKTLSKEWKEHFYPEFTRRSQRLSEFEKTEKARQVKAEEEARNAVDKDETLSKVPSDVREAIVRIVKPQFDSWVKEQQQAQAQAEEDRQWEAKISSLESKYNGKNGLPKFDKIDILRAMQIPGNKNFDPESKFYELHREEFEEAKVREALKKKGGSLSTEATGRDTGFDRKPEGKTPSSFDEASKRFLSRIKGE